MKIITVVGARPQFIKAAAVSRAISEHNRHGSKSAACEVIVHTGQHYDENMSHIFFEDLGIPKPDYNLDVGSGPHGAMTGRMLESIERVLICEKPDWLLIYGDTNSTVAGALAAAKLHIPIAHVEAGLRSYNRRMPEEVNRVLADHMSTLLLCPTSAAVTNLAREGVTQSVHDVGDVMYDVSLHYRDIARQRSDVLERHRLVEGEYVLATCHRAENTDDPGRLSEIVAGLARISKELPVVLPLHPRTRQCLKNSGLDQQLSGVMLLEPLSFLDMMRLEQSARAILTDSGGVQKEACFFRVPCVTLRDETEWVETVAGGWNTLVGAESSRIFNAFQDLQRPMQALEAYGNGHAAAAVLQLLLNHGSPG